ncbi:MAG: prolipoprotein diacylglyceryl transferase [Alphaproteobacteria bacterium]
MALVLPFPTIDPVLVEIGPFAIRWYALAYIVGLLAGWAYVRHLAALAPQTMNREQVDDLLVWVTLGVILGGRLGYVLFYQPGYYVHHPLEALAVWHGGMSFHGGLAGVLLAGWIFARRRGLCPLRVGDLVACAAPIGIFLGRLANFVNAELWGRPTDVAWAFVFPTDPLGLPRHPSQLYEAALEGVVLFVLLFALTRRRALRERPGLLGGVFLAGYAVARITAEFYRQPDAHIGFLAGGATMGQILSVPLLVAGVALIVRARRNPPVAG